MIYDGKREIKINADFIFTYDNAKFEEIAFALCISPEQLELELIRAANAFQDMFYNVLEVVKEIREKVSSISIHKNGQENYKLDFSRPQIKHQILDRKPKRLIKKIIH